MSRTYPCVYCTEDGYCKKFSDEESVSWCVLGPCKDEKPSNADRIRAMTDEELAKWIEDRLEPNNCPSEEMGENCGKRICDNCWLDWLKEEVDDE